MIEPIVCCGEAEDAEEGTRGLFVAGGDGAPFLQPRPEVLDEVAVVVDPLWAGDRRVGALGRDGGPRAQVPDALAKGIGGEARSPTIHPGTSGRQPSSPGARGSSCACPGASEGDGAPTPVGNHAGLRAIAAARAAKRLAHLSLLAVDPLFSAPAALW